MHFKDEDEVIARANNSEYGLAAGLSTRDINRPLRVAGEFEAGMVGVNCISRLFSTRLLVVMKTLDWDGNAVLLG
jgi:aldehyde dehydrogenase (NAD+)